MSVLTASKTLSFLLTLLNAKKTTEPVTDLRSNKPVFDENYVDEFALPRCTPEEVGVATSDVVNLVKELYYDKSLNMHNILIVKDGNVIFEAAFGDHSLNLPKMTFSACKSITSIAIGALYTDGLITLEEKVSDILKIKHPTSKLQFSSLTVENLLTMKSGSTFAEANTAVDNEWTQSFFDYARNAAPGKKFNYNSLNTFILSAIVCQKTGKTMSEYLNERVFKHIGVKDYFWEVSNDNIEKGGWGLFIRPEDLAKIGMLLVNNGVAPDGTQVISKQYVKLATRGHVKAPLSYGRFNYAYQIWAERNRNIFLFNGLFGQNMLAFPEMNMVIVTNAGNNEFFQQGNYYDCAIKNLYLKSIKPTTREIAASHKAIKEVKELIKSDSYSLLLKTPSVLNALKEKCSSMNNMKFVTKDPKAVSVGLLPLVLQGSQNNFAKGLKSISFRYEKDILVMDYAEIEDTYSIPIGFVSAQKTIINYNQEPFHIATRGTFTKNEDGEEVLKIKIDFLDSPSTRILKFIFKYNCVEVIHDELPGRECAWMFLVDNVSDAIQTKAILKNAVELIDQDYVKFLIGQVFTPKMEFKKEI